MQREKHLRAQDTRPLVVELVAEGLSNLGALVEARAYFRRVDQQSNHIDGVVVAVQDSGQRLLSVPVVGSAVGGGNAFTLPGTYRGYIRATWTDGSTTRHPAKQQHDLRIVVAENYES